MILAFEGAKSKFNFFIGFLAHFRSPIIRDDHDFLAKEPPHQEQALGLSNEHLFHLMFGYILWTFEFRLKGKSGGGFKKRGDERTQILNF